MAKKGKFMDQIEKDNLIQTIWADKKGRLSRSGNMALYVALDSPRPSLIDLTRLMLDELANEAKRYEALEWARTWGKVVVCVQSGGALGCFLADTEDRSSKSFVPIVTIAKILPEQLIGDFSSGNLAEVILNNQPTTVEATTICFVHMVDEMIWDIYRKNTLTYQEAVMEVMNKGFGLSIASEEEILEAVKRDFRVSVRLYGSGVNCDVPKVMGGILWK